MNDERYLKARFAYFTECQLATLEGLKLKKSTPKSELRRQEDISMKMVEVCKAVNVIPDRCPRLQQRLAVQSSAADKATPSR